MPKIGHKLHSITDGSLLSMKPKAVGIHIFAGGFTYGMKQAGFNVLCHLEIGDYGVASAKANWPGLPIHVGEKQWPLEDLAKENVDVIYGNPPCAIFSSMGIVTTRGKDAWRDDPRTDCWKSMVRAFLVIKPKVFALESVIQAYTTGKELVDELTKLAIGEGYSVQHVLLNGMWAGIPQARKRLFLVFHQPWLPLEFRFDYQTPMTVGEALASVVDPGYISPTRKDLIAAMKRTPQGGKLVTVWEQMNPGFHRRKNASGKIKGRPSFQDCRLAADRPMGAYVADKFYHPTKHRRIGINEAKALCGYPSDFILVERQGPALGSMLARAVMPPVGQWLGTAMRNVLKQPFRKWCQPTVTLADLRKPAGTYLDLTADYLNGIDRKFLALLQLACAVKSCDACPAMRGRYRVLSQLNGSVAAKIMFVGEAPGKDTVGRVGVPMYGDATGSNFDSLLRMGELSRQQAFIANAVLCCPLDRHGKMRPPTDQEIDHCSLHVKKLIELIDPQLVVALGNAGLRGLAKISPHRQRIGGTPVDWLERKLIALPHPSPRVVANQSLVSQADSYKRLKTLVNSPVKPVALDRPVAVPLVKSTGNQKSLLLTGSTPMQVGSQRTQMKIITAMAAWREALTDLGYAVDWRVVQPGEDLSNYQFVVAALNKPVSIASHWFYGALWSLSTHPRAIAVMDDWQTTEFMPGVRTCAKTVKRAFRIFQHVPEQYRQRLYEMLLRLRDEPWSWQTIVPVFEGGNLDLLELTYGPLIGIDPTSYVQRYPAVHSPKERQWVQASLLLKDPPMTTWPVAYFGNAGRARGGVGKTDRPAQLRLVETELMQEYCRSWGVFSPAHNHSGSGWWRVRYLMAADAGCILSANSQEAACLGEPYTRAAGPAGAAAVERLSDGMLRRWARDQKDQLAKVAWPRERVLEVLGEVLERANRVERPISRIGRPPVSNRPLKPHNLSAKRLVLRSTEVKLDHVPVKNAGSILAVTGETAGQFIRRLWMTGDYTNSNGVQQLVDLVHQNWSQFSKSTTRECRTTRSDIYWNYRKLLETATDVPTWPSIR